METLTRKTTKNGLLSPDPISAKVETISPNLAELLLEKQISKEDMKQRPLTQGVVTRFAKDMKAGRWRLNGEPIIISDRGNLLDGQHRLSAVILAEKAIQFLVVRGVDEDSFVSMGQGKKRSIGDVLFIKGKQYYKHLGSILMMYYAWENYKRLGKPGGRDYPTNEQLANLLEKHPGLEHAASYVGRKWANARFLPVHVFGTLYYIFEGIDPELRNDFWGKLVTGAGLEQGDPILILRERLIAMRETEIRDRIRYNAEEKAALIIKTWNAIREGKTIYRLSYRHTDGLPMPI